MATGTNPGGVWYTNGNTRESPIYQQPLSSDTWQSREVERRAYQARKDREEEARLKRAECDRREKEADKERRARQEERSRNSHCCNDSCNNYFYR